MREISESAVAARMVARKTIPNYVTTASQDMGSRLETVDRLKRILTNRSRLNDTKKRFLSDFTREKLKMELILSIHCQFRS